MKVNPNFVSEDEMHLLEVGDSLSRRFSRVCRWISSADNRRNSERRFLHKWN